jgi:formate/nitrite transporter
LLKWETILSYSTPAETAELAVESGATKAALPAGKMLVGGFLAGAYIAFGGLLAIVASAGLKPETWGGLVTLVTGLVFSLGLILVVIGGAELLTGNMMLVPLAVLKKRTTLSRLGINWAMLTVGNLIGTAASKVGTPAASNFARLSSISIGKALTESDLQIFLRAVGCNWLVCAAVWLALSAKDIGGKILAIVFPITAFVALGFDHVVANMFFLPLAMFQHVPGVTIGHVVSNLVIAFIGNALGASLFVSGAYWYLYLQHAPAAPRAEQRAHQNGRSANVGADSA